MNCLIREGPSDRSRLCSSNVNRPTVHGQRRFFQGFSKRRMCVRAAGQIFTARAKGNGYRRFRDQITSARSYDMHSENAIGFLVRQHLHFAFHLTEGQRPAVRAKREHPFPKRYIRGHEFFFGFTDGSNSDSARR